MMIVNIAINDKLVEVYVSDSQLAEILADDYGITQEKAEMLIEQFDLQDKVYDEYYDQVQEYAYEIWRCNYDIHRRRLTFDIGIRCDDDLSDLPLRDAREKLLYAKIIGCHAIHRRDRAIQNVIGAVEFLDFFQRHYRFGIFYNANERMIARAIRTDMADRLIAEVSTDLALANIAFRRDDCIGKRFGILFRHIKNGKGIASRRFLSNSGKAAKFLDQFLQRKNIFHSVTLPSID